MLTLDDIDDRGLAREPKSWHQRLEELKQGMLKNGDLGKAGNISRMGALCLEFLAAFEEVGTLPGVVEGSLAGSVSDRAMRVTGEWEVADESSKEFSEKIDAAKRLAVHRWLERGRLGWMLSGVIADVLPRAKQRESDGDIDGAIDLINDAFDELFRRGVFPLCDSLLGEIAVNEYSTDILLTVLTATAPAKEHLRSRKKFFAAAKKVMKTRKEYERGILDGLE